MKVPTDVGKEAEAEVVPTMEVPTDGGNEAETEAEEVPTLEVPTYVGNATLEDPLGEEQSVDGEKIIHITVCGGANWGRMGANDERLEVATNSWVRKLNFNLKHKLEDEDPVHRTKELRSYVESDWEESETCSWDTEDLWNSDIDMEDALGMGHA